LLKQLPENWVVICNVSWALKDDYGSVRDGQADFVVLAPELGLAVVEVKGSKLVRVDEDGIWYRSVFDSRGKKVTENVVNPPPPEQACGNLHTLAQVVKEELGLRDFPGLHAWLVVYPNGAVEGKADTYDDSTIVAKNRLHQIGGAIRTALLAKGAESTGKKFRQDLVDRAAEILTNQRFRVVAADTELDVDEDEKNIDELTRQQFAALRGAFELPRVAIIGPAGSGKTLLAIWKLSALLEEGKKAIFVCFNKPLAEHLRVAHPDMASAVVSVDSLFWGLVDDKTGRSGKDFYTRVLPARVEEAVYSLKDDNKYDAIIVDEGQDFGDERIVALFQLLKDSDNSHWLYFADSKQDLYGRGTDETLGAEVTFRLYHNCRNTERVNAATNKICIGEVKPMPGVPSGEIPQVSICKVDHMAQKAWSLVHELGADGGAVILSPFKLRNSCMDSVRKAHGLDLTEDISKLGQPGFVYFSTIKSFKGLEARHVVLVHADKPGVNPALEAEDLYVAFTRATARLDVVTDNPQAESWFTGSLQSLR
jgi:hypothetical protein